MKTFKISLLLVILLFSVGFTQEVLPKATEDSVVEQAPVDKATTVDSTPDGEITPAAETAPEVVAPVTGEEVVPVTPATPVEPEAVEEPLAPLAPVVPVCDQIGFNACVQNTENITLCGTTHHCEEQAAKLVIESTKISRCYSQCSRDCVFGIVAGTSLDSKIPVGQCFSDCSCVCNKECTQNCDLSPLGEMCYISCGCPADEEARDELLEQSEEYYSQPLDPRTDDQITAEWNGKLADGIDKKSKQTDTSERKVLDKKLNKLERKWDKYVADATAIGIDPTVSCNLTCSHDCFLETDEASTPVADDGSELYNILTGCLIKQCQCFNPKLPHAQNYIEFDGLMKLSSLISLVESEATSEPIDATIVEPATTTTAKVDSEPLEPVVEPVVETSTPVEAATVEAATVEAAPVEAAPVKAAPVEVAPIEVAPVKADPIEATPIEVTPVKVDPIEAASVSEPASVVSDKAVPVSEPTPVVASEVAETPVEVVSEPTPVEPTPTIVPEIVIPAEVSPTKDTPSTPTPIIETTPESVVVAPVVEVTPSAQTPAPVGPVIEVAPSAQTPAPVGPVIEVTPSAQTPAPVGPVIEVTPSAQPVVGPVAVVTPLSQDPLAKDKVDTSTFKKQKECNLKCFRECLSDLKKYVPFPVITQCIDVRCHCKIESKVSTLDALVQHAEAQGILDMVEPSTKTGIISILLMATILIIIFAAIGILAFIYNDEKKKKVVDLEHWGVAQHEAYERLT
jgi:hypothetical protein